MKLVEDADVPAEFRNCGPLPSHDPGGRRRRDDACNARRCIAGNRFERPTVRPWSEGQTRARAADPWHVRRSIPAGAKTRSWAKVARNSTSINQIGRPAAAAATACASRRSIADGLLADGRKNASGMRTVSPAAPTRPAASGAANDRVPLRCRQIVAQHQSHDSPFRPQPNARINVPAFRPGSATGRQEREEIRPPDCWRRGAERQSALRSHQGKVGGTRG